MNIQNQAPYPIASFPEWIRNALIEAQNTIMTTPVVVAVAALTAMSKTVDGLADWRHPTTGQIRPCSLNLWLAAESGDRKTATDALLCSPIYAQDEKSLLEHTKNQDRYKVEHDRWTSINNGIRKRIAKLAGAGEPTAEVELKLEEHAKLKPSAPRLRRLIRQDISLRSIFEALEGNGESLALMVDEGHIILNSKIMQHIGVLNKIWDGCRLLTYDRGDFDNIIVRNPRATISIMVQPAVLSEFIAKHGKITHGSGHWARYLIARSPSIQGYRFPITVDAELRDLLPFHSRISELLQLYQVRISNSPISRDVVEFDDNSKQVWLQIASAVENDIKPGHYLNDIGDFASKYMDIVGRIASILHYFGKMDGKIKPDTLSRAEAIASWHLHEYKQVFSPALHRSPDQIDGDKVYAYLYHKYFTKNCFEISKNLIRQYCGVRGERFTRAVIELCSRSAIQIQLGRNKTQIIQINPYFFSVNPA